MAAVAERALQLQNARALEKRTAEKLKKLEQSNVGRGAASGSRISQAEFVLLLHVTVLNDVSDLIALTGVGKIVTIFIDIICSVILFAWAYVRLGHLPPAKRGRTSSRFSRRWKRKFFKRFAAELIPFVGLGPWWTMWLIKVYRNQDNE